MDLTKGLTRADFKKIQDKYGPSLELIEQNLHALELALTLQKADPNFVLFGGTATQLFLPPTKRRASKDVDLLCNYTPAEVPTKVRDILEKNGHVIQRDYLLRSGLIPGHGFKIVTGSVIRSGYPTGQVEVVCDTEAKLNITTIDVEIFGFKISGVHVLSPESLFAKKLLTLDIDNLGLPRYDQQGNDNIMEIVKQLYDVLELYQLLSPGYRSMALAIEKNFKDELALKKVDNQVSVPLKRVLSNIASFWKIDYPDTRRDQQTKDWQSGVSKFTAYYASSDVRKGYLWSKNSLLLIHFISKAILFLETQDDKHLKEHLDLVNNNSTDSPKAELILAHPELKCFRRWEGHYWRFLKALIDDGTCNL